MLIERSSNKFFKKKCSVINCEAFVIYHYAERYGFKTNGLFHCRHCSGIKKYCDNHKEDFLKKDSNPFHYICKNDEECIIYDG